MQAQTTGRDHSPPPLTPHPVLASRLLRLPFLSHEERLALVKAMSPASGIKASVDLLREGDRGDSLFIIVEGWACRYITTRDGSRQFPALLVPGDVGNLDTLLFEQADYGVRTLTSATVVALPRDRALALTERHAGIARAFTWLAMAENTTLSRWAVSLGRRSAKERLAHLLCELNARLHPGAGGESRFAFPLTQEHVADALGLTAVHVNRTMRQLRDEGLIEIGERVMTLRDVARLRRLGEFDESYLHLDPVSGQAS